MLKNRVGLSALILSTRVLLLFYILYCFTSCIVLHPVLFYILYCFTSCIVLHPVLFYILYCFTSCIVLHPVLFYILYCRLFQFLSVTYSGRLDNSKFLFMIVNCTCRKLQNVRIYNKLCYIYAMTLPFSCSLAGKESPGLLR